MGWWKDNTSKDTILGDEPLDITHEFLQHFRDIYKQEFQRPPKIAELFKTIEIILKFQSDELFCDCELVDIKKIRLQTAKRKKRQSFKLGDYFGIPLNNNKIIFGRILFRDEMGYLIELYKKLENTYISPEYINHVEKLIHPIYTISDAWKNWKWKILGGHENFSIDNFEHPTFKLGNDDIGWQISCGDLTRSASKEEVENLIELKVLLPEQIEFDLNRYFNAIEETSQKGTIDYEVSFL